MELTRSKTSTSTAAYESGSVVPASGMSSDSEIAPTAVSSHPLVVQQSIVRPVINEYPNLRRFSSEFSQT